MPFVDKKFTYKDAMGLSKSHLALLVLSHRRSIVLLENRISELEAENEQANKPDRANTRSFDKFDRQFKNGEPKPFLFK